MKKGTQMKKCRQPPKDGKGKGNGFPAQPSDGTSTADTWVLPR